jgi:hypothetical protein
MRKSQLIPLSEPAGPKAIKPQAKGIFSFNFNVLPGLGAMLLVECEYSLFTITTTCTGAGIYLCT